MPSKPRFREKKLLKIPTDTDLPLKLWYTRLAHRWQHVAAYYLAPTTSALSEGVNNVIKMVKRRAFGYRNMEYFKLKIMQVSGLLRSNYVMYQGLEG